MKRTTRAQIEEYKARLLLACQIRWHRRQSTKTPALMREAGIPPHHTLDAVFKWLKELEAEGKLVWHRNPKGHRRGWFEPVEKLVD